MAFSLRNLKVNRVALVDKGANFDKESGDGAHIMLFKRDTSKEAPSLSAVHVDVPGGKPKKKETPVEKKSLFEKIKALVAKDDNDMTPEEKKAAAAEMDKAKKAADDEDVEKVALAKKDADTATAVEKKVTDLEKRLAESDARAVAAEAVAKSERDARALAEQTTILKSFKGVSVDVAKDAPILKQLQETNKAAYDRVIELLTAADTQVATSKAFETFGSNAGAVGKGSAWAQIEGKARDLVTKGGTGLTFEKAVDKIMDENPALVRQYRAEQQ